MQLISNGKTYADNNIDIKNKIVTFESGDDLNPTAPVDMPKITSGHSMKDFLRWGSLAVKNIRYLLKMLGTTDISAISDGTLTGAISEISEGMLFVSNYENQKTVNNSSYTAEFNCMVYVNAVTNTTSFGEIVVAVNGVYVRHYQNPTNTQGLSDGTLTALKKGDVLSVFGNGLKNCSMVVQY